MVHFDLSFFDKKDSSNRRLGSGELQEQQHKKKNGKKGMIERGICKKCSSQERNAAPLLHLSGKALVYLHQSFFKRC